MLVLQANIFEYPLADTVDSDLRLTNFAVSVLNKMSDASTLMAMKRMNVVATELDYRARLGVDKARHDVAFRWCTQLDPGPFGLGQQDHQSSLSTQTPAAELRWDWGNDGVEAWPGMDFSLKESITVSPTFETFDSALGPFEVWNSVGMHGMYDTEAFTEQAIFVESI